MGVTQLQQAQSSASPAPASGLEPDTGASRWSPTKAHGCVRGQHFFGSRVLANSRLISTLLADTLAEGPCAIGWGRKPSGRLAREWAERKGARLLLLEDGLLRSWGLGVEKADGYSLIIDPTGGIYYDATMPSQVENLLNSANPLPDAMLADAQRLIRLLREHGLSKYACAQQFDPRRDFGSTGTRRRVLVIDQTAGDASIPGSLAHANTFERMLDAAIDENPDAEVWVKVHPDVACGAKKGFLLMPAHRRAIGVISSHVDPWSLLAHFSKVYTVSSQMGLEALMADIPVVCFGMPFYAGWGLTDDRIGLIRRRGRRTLNDIVAASYLASSRYLNPMTRQPGTVFDVVDYLADKRRKALQPADHLVVIGMRRWKQPMVLPFLKQIADQVSFVPNEKRALPLVQDPGSQITVWGNRNLPRELRAANPRPVLRLEDGFLRSVGLGSDFIAPICLVADQRGLYFDATTNSDLEELLNDADLSADELARAQHLHTRITELALTKYNVGDRRRGLRLDASARDRNRILIVGQVEDDASLRFGSCVVESNLDLVRLVRQHHPDAYLIYKPHPEVVTGNRKGRIDARMLAGLVDRIEEHADIVSCLEAAQELHCMTSLAGFDALLRGKQVTTYGMPFYAGWGLTTDWVHTQRRNRQRSLDELIAIVFLRYCRYANPETGEPMQCEQAIEMLATRLAQAIERDVARQTSVGFAALAPWRSLRMQPRGPLQRALRYARGAWLGLRG